MTDAEQCEVVADLVHHRVDGFGLEQGEPFALVLADIFVAEIVRQSLSHGDKIVARIHPFRNFADLFAQRFAVAQVRRPRERIDLAPGIVDVIFADHLVPGKSEQAGERVTYDCAAAVPHVHRPGRIGRDILDIDAPPFAHGRAAVSVAARGNRAEFGEP